MAGNDLSIGKLYIDQSVKYNDSEQFIEFAKAALSVILDERFGPANSQQNLKSAEETEIDCQIDAIHNLFDELSADRLFAQYENLEAKLPTPLSRRIQFRIGMNKALCRLRMGEIEPAARDMIEAYNHAPTEANAVSHKILAHWLLGEPQEACDFGDAALAEMPNNELAAFYLIQARADLPSITDPLEGLSDDLRDRPKIRSAEIIFLRRRDDTAGWWRRAKEAAARYPEDDDLIAAAALAVVDEITHDKTSNATRTLSEAQRSALSAAAEPLDRAWRRVRRRLKEPFEQDAQYLSAALVCAYLLRDQATIDTLLDIIDKEELAEPGVIATACRVLEHEGRRDLLDRLIKRAIDHPAVRFQAAMASLERGDIAEGLHLFEGAAIPPEEAAPVRVIQNLAPWLNGEARPTAAQLDAIVPIADDDPRALVFIARTARDHGLEAEADRIFARAVERAVSSGTLPERATVAISASSMGRHTDVIDLLDDVPGVREDVRLVLRLARAHANESPRRIRNLRFFEQLSEEMASDWEIACHRAAFFASVDKSEAIDLAWDLHKRNPQDAFAAALLVNQLRIANRNEDLKSVASQIDPFLLDGYIQHKIVVIHAIRREVDPKLALRAAYELVTSAPNDVDAVTGYIFMHMAHIYEHRTDSIFDEADIVQAGCWVKLTADNDTTLEFVIGTDERTPGAEVFPADHPIAAAAMGRRTGDTFSFQKNYGISVLYTVDEVKSKFLHVWQYLSGSFGERFPKSRAVFSAQVSERDFSSIESVMRHRNEAIKLALDDYNIRQLPLAFCARRISSDPVTFAHEVRAQGGQIVASVGETEELDAALSVGRAARGKGIVLDPFTAVIAADIGMLSALKAYFGELLTTNSTLRLLDSISERFTSSEPEGLSQLCLGEQGLYREFTAAEVLAAHKTKSEQTAAAIREHCTIKLALIPDNAPKHLIDLVAVAGERVLDTLSLARNESLPILSDDIRYRDIAYITAEVPGLWLQAALLLCRQQNLIDTATYARSVAMLARLKHGHTILDIPMMQEAFALGANDNHADFQVLSSYIGVEDMVLKNHARFIVATWMDIREHSSNNSQQSEDAALGIMLRSFMSGAKRDWATRLMALMRVSRNNDYFRLYLLRWLRGHFYIDDSNNILFQPKSTRARRGGRKQGRAQA